MITITEQKFWKSIRRTVDRLGWWAERVENTVSGGWPDVVVFTPTARTIMAELKVAKGPKARIKVRAEQPLFAERISKLPGKNLQFFFLVIDDRRRGEFWVLTDKNIRLAMKHGILHPDVGAQKYSTKSLALCLRRWNGENVYIQQADPTPVEKPSGLDFLPEEIPARSPRVRIVYGAGI